MSLANYRPGTIPEFRGDVSVWSRELTARMRAEFFTIAKILAGETRAASETTVVRTSTSTSGGSSTGVGSGSVHDILSATHSDVNTVTTRTRGQLFYVNSSGQWDGLTVGSAGQYLYSDGSDPSWRSPLASDITMERIGASTYYTVQHLQDIFHSSGWSSGGTINDAGSGNITVDTGTGFIRASAARNATVYYFDFPALGSTAIPSDTLRYVGVEYNAGSPQVVVRTSYNWDFYTDFPLGTVVNEGGTLHIINSAHAVGDHANFMIQRQYQTMPFTRGNRGSGLILGETGTRYVTVTAGSIWERLEEFIITAIDTTPAGDTFDRYYQDGVGGWTKESAQTQWNNTQYDDGSGTLQTMNNNWYSAQYFYIELDGNLVSLYGQNQYSSIGAAVDDPTPSTVPLRLQAHGKLIGRIIFKRNDATATQIETVFSTNFTSAGVTDHGSLSGLTDDDHTQYALLAGRSGGQTLYGSTAAGENLTLGSTANATKGKIFFGASSAYDEVNTRLGIGTTSPAKQLVLYRSDTDNASQLDIEQASTGDAAMRFLLTGVRGWFVGVDNSDGDKFKIDASGGVGSDTKLTIDVSGNVGIGTTSPSEALEVAGDVQITTAGLALTRTTQSSHIGYGDRNGLSVTNVDATDFYISGGDNNDLIIASRANSANEGIKLGNTSGGTFSTHVLVDGTSGNVGIGTTSPYGPLEVAFTASAGSDIHESSIISRNSSGASNSAGGYSFYRTTSERAKISMDYFTGLQFWTAEGAGALTSRMTIDDNGNVGIGTTSPARPLHVSASGSNAYIRLSSTTANAYGEFRFIDDGAGNYYPVFNPGSAVNAPLTIYNPSSGSSYALQVRNYGGSFNYMRFYHNDVDGYITTNSGDIILSPAANVGISTTSPSYKLDVTGDARVTGKLINYSVVRPVIVGTDTDKQNPYFTVTIYNYDSADPNDPNSETYLLHWWISTTALGTPATRAGVSASITTGLGLNTLTYTTVNHARTDTSHVFVLQLSTGNTTSAANMYLNIEVQGIVYYQVVQIYTTSS